VAARFQLGGERVVSQAAPAVHPRRTRGYEKDLHMLDMLAL